jgi:hypothetical protein
MVLDNNAIEGAIMLPDLICRFRPALIDWRLLIFGGDFFVCLDCFGCCPLDGNYQSIPGDPVLPGECAECRSYDARLYFSAVHNA